MKLDLNVAWEILNDVCFDGELIRPRIYAYNTLIESPSTTKERVFLLGAYQHGCDDHRNEILIWNRLGHLDKLEALYHEMVHQYLHEVLEEHGGGHPATYYEIYDEGVNKLCQYTKKGKATSGAATVRSTKAPEQPLKQRPKVAQRTRMVTKERQVRSLGDEDDPLFLFSN